MRRRQGGIFTSLVVVFFSLMVVGASWLYKGWEFVSKAREVLSKVRLEKTLEADEAMAWMGAAVRFAPPPGYHALGAFSLGIPVPSKSDPSGFTSAAARVAFVGPEGTELGALIEDRPGMPTVRDDVNLNVFVVFGWVGPLADELRKEFRRYVDEGGRGKAFSVERSGEDDGVGVRATTRRERRPDPKYETLVEETVDVRVGGETVAARRQVRRNKQTGDEGEMWVVWLSPRAALMALGRHGHFDRKALDQMLATVRPVESGPAVDG